MTPSEKLIQLFGKFPGIGPRQARRFVFFLLSAPPGLRSDLVEAIKDLGGSVAQCASCNRYFSGRGSICSICGDPDRDHGTLMLVERDVDLESVERSGTYKGLYFVLGGTIPLLAEHPPPHVRITALDARLKNLKDDLSEVILAFSATADGDATTRFITEHLKSLKLPERTTLSILGRGLSTGSELEYADPETIRSALKGRGV